MKDKLVISHLIIILALLCGCKENKNNSGSIKEAFQDKFFIGMALNEAQILGTDINSVNIIKEHCNSITAENCMKIGLLQPIEGQFDFYLADKFVSFGETNNMKIIGHNLVWHTQAPDWFFIDDNGQDVSKAVLIDRMEMHIKTVVGRYKGEVHGWDVVNEAILDDGSWRQNKFYTIIGEEYVALAFKFAHATDPNAELYYNDYSVALEGKRKGIVELVKSLQEQNIRIDGVGMQMHCGLQYPTVQEQEKSIEAIAALNVKLMITELDVSVLPLPARFGGADVQQTSDYAPEMDPYSQNLPDSVYKIQHKVVLDYFRLYIKYQDIIDRVTLWGVTDNQSWKNDWPIPGRTDYPLFFDRNYNAKPFVGDIIELGKQSN